MMKISAEPSTTNYYSVEEALEDALWYLLSQEIYN